MTHRQSALVIWVVACVMVMINRTGSAGMSAPRVEGKFKVRFSLPSPKKLMHNSQNPVRAEAWAQRRAEASEARSTTTMGKRCLRSDIAKGKQQIKNEHVPAKRGRKTNKEHLENLVLNYLLGNASPTRNQIRGWERELQVNPEDDAAAADILDFIQDPGNTQGRFTLFNQSIHTYWVMKCLLAKAIQSAQPPEYKVQPKTETFLKDLLENIDTNLQHIKFAQHQAIQRLDDRMGRIEKLFQHMQQTDMPGSRANDPAPVSSSDG